MPFDRLVRVVDAWAGSGRRKDVFAQVGASQWTPTHLSYSAFLPPDEFARRFAAAKVVVAHAGMGTILSALRWEKPLLVMPRRAALGEQRNDHQIATARHLSALGKVNVAMDDDDLRRQLDLLDDLTPRTPIGPYASRELTDALRAFVQSSQRGKR